MTKVIVVAFLLVCALLLGGTVLREPIASAGQSIGATILGPLDAQGNVRVHEQGTASVSGTVGLAASANSVKIDPSANAVTPVSAPSDALGEIVGVAAAAGQLETTPLNEVVDASLLVVNSDDNVYTILFTHNGQLVFALEGPVGKGASHYVLPFPTPIRFDSVTVLCGNTQCSAGVSVAGRRVG